MAQKKAVFVGEGSLLYRFLAYQWLFEKRGWHVVKVETIDNAKKVNGALLIVVFAYCKAHIEELSLWENHPPVIWHYFPYFDESPENVHLYDARQASPKAMLGMADSVIAQ